MKQVPIRDHMTLIPKTIEKGRSLADALKLMHESHIRHLPVRDGDTVIGILSDRNTQAASILKGAETYRVEEIMMPEPYTVAPDTELTAVINEMIRCKYGSAIIQEPEGEVSGIFTTIDALRLLKGLLSGEDLTPHAGADPHAVDGAMSASGLSLQEVEPWQ